MGKKRWTTAEQFTWLEALIPGFVQAQENKAVSSFLKDVYDKWEKKWTIPPPTEEEVKSAKGNNQKALAIKLKGTENVRYHNESYETFTLMHLPRTL